MAREEMASEAKRVYTMAEVSAHNSPKDCWIVIGGKVYDVTKFLANHPGGDEILLASVGKDATNDFEDVGHGTAARATLDEHCVGRIDAATIPRKFNYTPPKQTHYDQDKTYDFMISLLEFVAPLAILGLAVGVRVYNLSA